MKCVEFLFFLIFIVGSTCIQANKEKSNDKEMSSHNKNKIGYSIGLYHIQTILLESNHSMQNEDYYHKTFGIESKKSQGVILGLFYNYELTPLVNIRAGINFLLNSTQRTGEQKQNKRGRSIQAIELPLHMSIAPFSGNEIYFIGGGKIVNYLDLVRKTHYSGRNTDLSMDIGIGFPLNFTFFNLLPELRYSFGLTNLMVTKANLNDGQTSNLANLTRNSISLIISSY